MTISSRAGLLMLSVLGFFSFSGTSWAACTSVTSYVTFDGVFAGQRCSDRNQEHLTGLYTDLNNGEQLNGVVSKVLQGNNATVSRSGSVVGPFFEGTLAATSQIQSGKVVLSMETRDGAELLWDGSLFDGITQISRDTSTPLCSSFGACQRVVKDGQLVTPTSIGTQNVFMDIDSASQPYGGNIFWDGIRHVGSGAVFDGIDGTYFWGEEAGNRYFVRQSYGDLVSPSYVGYYGVGTLMYETGELGYFSESWDGVEQLDGGVVFSGQRSHSIYGADPVDIWGEGTLSGPFFNGSYAFSGTADSFGHIIASSEVFTGTENRETEGIFTGEVTVDRSANSTTLTRDGNIAAAAFNGSSDAVIALNAGGQLTSSASVLDGIWTVGQGANLRTYKGGLTVSINAQGNVTVNDTRVEIPSPAATAKGAQL